MTSAEVSAPLPYFAASATPTRASERVQEDDRVSMVRLAAGEIGALGDLYDLHQAAVRRFLSRMSGDAADVDDLVHATFLQAFEHAGAFDPARPCRAWLLGIAANLFRRSRSTRARWARLLRGFSSETPASLRDPERAIAAREELGRLDRALSSLSPAKREVVLLSELEGLNGEEIATALGIPVGTVWTRLHHARRELLALVEPTEER